VTFGDSTIKEASVLKKETLDGSKRRRAVATFPKRNLSKQIVEEMAQRFRLEALPRNGDELVLKPFDLCRKAKGQRPLDR